MRLLLVSVARGRCSPRPPQRIGSGGYIPQSCPLKGLGDWVDRFPRGYVIPLMCGNLGI